MPAVRRAVHGFFGRRPRTDVHPGEAIALGAAIRAGVLAGQTQDVVVVDVIPASLGIDTLGGVVSVLIPRNTSIPTSKKETFTTAADNQTDVLIKVRQGERPRATDNARIGALHLTGIEPAPRGTPQIEVSFDIDADGILSVRAKDLSTGKAVETTIEYRGQTRARSGTFCPYGRWPGKRGAQEREKITALRAYQLAQQLLSGGNWKAALRQLKQAVSLNPQLAEAHETLAELYGDRAAALHCCSIRKWWYKYLARRHSKKVASSHAPR